MCVLVLADCAAVSVCVWVGCGWVLADCAAVSVPTFMNSTIVPVCLQLQMQNDVEAKSIDTIFASNQEAQLEISRLEEAIDKEKRMAETLVANMDPQTATSYRQLQEEGRRLEQVSHAPLASEIWY